MDIESLENEFRKKVCDEIEIIREGKDRFVVATPFTFEDGDNLNTILKKNGTGWYFTDEGHTFMHLSYDDLDFERGKYPVDCYVKNDVPLFIFGPYNNDKCRDSTITCLTYEKWDIPFTSIAIFENQEDINKRVLARFSDVIEKQYSSLTSAKERLPDYLKKISILS